MLSKLSELAQFSIPPEEYIAGIQKAVFEERALELFRYQYAHNALYREYCNALRIDAPGVRTLVEIPFLPISFFKTHRVQTGDWTDAALVFESSGTTGETVSRHYVRDAELYEASLLAGFSYAFGDVEDWTFLALLPSYLERKNASLVHMARVLMKHSGQTAKGFYLDDWKALTQTLQGLKEGGKKTLLLGVTFALLDFAADHPMDLEGITVMETGGMKGRREEWTRAQVHDYLKAHWKLSGVATEYGMTELLSQAYALEDGLLQPARTMRVLVRELSDPLTVHTHGSGVLNIIDLANVHSCAFVATEDIGIVYDAGTFEVLGRMDHAALRGCSLMAAQ